MALLQEIWNLSNSIKTRYRTDSLKRSLFMPTMLDFTMSSITLHLDFCNFWLFTTRVTKRWTFILTKYSWLKSLQWIWSNWLVQQVNEYSQPSFNYLLIQITIQPISNSQKKLVNRLGRLIVLSCNLNFSHYPFLVLKNSRLTWFPRAQGKHSFQPVGFSAEYLTSRNPRLKVNLEMYSENWPISPVGNNQRQLPGRFAFFYK